MSMNSFNLEEYHQIKPQNQLQSTRLQQSCKFVIILTIFMLAIVFYYALTTITSQGDYIVIQKSILLSVYQDSNTELTIIIEDANHQTYSIPNQQPFPTNKLYQQQSSEQLLYSYTLNTTQPYLSLAHTITQETILIITNISTSVDIQLQNSNAFGYKQGNHTIWPTNGNPNYHPMWLQKLQSDVFYCAFLKVTSAISMDFNQNNLKIQLNGGKLILKLFIGLYDPEQPIKAYHRYINGYKLFPIDSIGYQYYYKGNHNITQLIEQFNNHNIPLDHLWIDMDQYDNTTQQVDEFKYINSYYNINLISSIRSTVPINQVDDKYLIKSDDTKQPIIGCVNGQNVNYLDFNNKRSLEQQQHPFDLSLFYGISLQNDNIINNDSICQVQSGTLIDGSLPMTAYHKCKNKQSLLINGKISEQFFRPLNSLGQMMQLNEKQQLILSSSTMYGSGQYCGQISNEGTSMIAGISQMIQYSLNGIPWSGLSGVDQGIQPLKLCARWFSLGAWLPLFRTYSSAQFIFDNHDFQEQALGELNLRYELMRWMYTQYLRNYDRQLGNAIGTIIKPIWWLHPNDSRAYQFDDREFLFSDTYLVIPLMDDPMNDYFTPIDMYFPQGYKWQSVKQQVTFLGGTIINSMILSTTSTPVFQRYGTIVFRQKPAIRVGQLDNSYSLIVLLDNRIAHGQILTLNSVDYQNVESKCLKQYDCLANVTIQSVAINYKETIFRMDIVGNTEHTIFEEFNINEILITGGQLRDFKPQQPLRIDGAGSYILDDVMVI